MTTVPMMKLPSYLQPFSGKLARPLRSHGPQTNANKLQRLCVTTSASSTKTQTSTEAGQAEHAKAGQQRNINWEIKMLYDGGCPLCMREVNMLKRRDAGVNKIAFVDIDTPEYTPAQNAGISYEQGMANIHGILPDGRVVTNVEVFRRLYEAVGLGWVYAITKNPVIGRVAEWVYGIWAKFRLPITGRPDLDVIMREKKTCR
ncbi:hypothetical protein CVIRNUC_001588 [Coccomyxa viridis]|uniref:Thiol-disulfide oxidoreductase DCC n=1 Tax=Coccomyxa viridis TaxID=1274662 RepID=A0AAV1HU15_9CHLO|nr:hypothetical protein CVIRNUC_001588 [Coccomyxa viridis]